MGQRKIFLLKQRTTLELNFIDHATIWRQMILRSVWKHSRRRRRTGATAGGGDATRLLSVPHPPSLAPPGICRQARGARAGLVRGSGGSSSSLQQRPAARAAATAVAAVTHNVAASNNDRTAFMDLAPSERRAATGTTTVPGPCRAVSILTCTNWYVNTGWQVFRFFEGFPWPRS